MKIKEIYYSSRFVKNFKKLPIKVQQAAYNREEIFCINCFDPRLNTHKLKGRLDGFWSFSVNYSYRIRFEFINDSEVGFIDIGDHSIYQ